MNNKEVYKSFSDTKEVIYAILIMAFVLVIIDVAWIKDYRLVFSLLPLIMLVFFSIFGFTAVSTFFWIIFTGILVLIYGDFRYIGMLYPVLFLLPVKIIYTFIKK